MDCKNRLHIPVGDYIMALYEDTQDGNLTLFYEDDAYSVNYLVQWDLEAAQSLTARFCTMLDQLEEVGKRYLEAPESLPIQLQEVWSIYVRPFGDHDLDGDLLQQISQKEDMGEPLLWQEKQLLQRFNTWLEQQCLQRLPLGRYAPTALIQRGMRYVKLVYLRAPAVVLEAEARFLAEELVLYTCAAPFHICRCCGSAYALDEPDAITWSVCPVCLWEEDGSEETERSSANDASLAEYQSAYFRSGK